MPMIEVDEAEIARLKGMEKLLNNMGSNPKTRARAVEIIKELTGVEAPELAVKNEISGELAALRKRLDDEKSEREKEKADATRRDALRGVEGKINEGRKTLREKGFTDDGIAGVEKIMQERGIHDYEVAAAYFEKTQPPDEPVIPTSAGGRSWDFARPAEKDDMHKHLMDNPDSFAHKMTQQVLGEYRQARRH